jgi:PadR family transcriptional regulator, regulatory protein PadR
MTQATKSTARTNSHRLALDNFLLTDFSRFYILLLLFEGQKHGYQIMSNVERRLDQKVSPSLVYPFLRLLEDQGLVKSKEMNVGQKTRNVYSLTGSGRSLCNRLFRQFTTIVSSAIEPSMEVCAHCGCRVYKDAYFEEIKGRKIAFCCKYCAAAYKKER